MKGTQVVTKVRLGDEVLVGAKNFTVDEIRPDGRVSGKNGEIHFTGFDQDFLKTIRRPAPVFAATA